MVRKPYRDFFRLRARISVDAILPEKLGFVFFSLSAKVGFEAASPTFCSLRAPLRCPFGFAHGFALLALKQTTSPSHSLRAYSTASSRISCDVFKRRVNPNGRSQIIA